MSRLSVVQHGHVLEVQFNRPKKGNAFDLPMWRELKTVMDTIAFEVHSGSPVALRVTEGPMKAAADLVPEGAEIRCVVFTGNGPNFCGGIDVSLLAEGGSVKTDDNARSGIQMRAMVLYLQEVVTSIANCPVPVIMAVHGACYGLGVDIITAGCIRLATKDCQLSVKEVDLGVTADVGVLQRLPLVCGNQSRVREWTYTARRFSADEALEAGLLSGPLAANKEELLAQALKLAQLIASKSPTAVYGSKNVMDIANRQKVDQGLNYVATLNGFNVLSADTEALVMAGMKKRKKGEAATPVTFSKL